MLLKKEIKETLTKALYDSSNILASTYDTTTHDLIIIFKSGTQYRYNNVSNSDYTRFEIAESQGIIFNTHIKKYSTEKLGNVDVTQVLNEATQIKTAEDEELAKGKRLKLIRLMKNIILIDDSIPFNEERFKLGVEKLQTGLKEYLN